MIRLLQIMTKVANRLDEKGLTALADVADQHIAQLTQTFKKNMNWSKTLGNDPRFRQMVESEMREAVRPILSEKLCKTAGIWDNIKNVVKAPFRAIAEPFAAKQYQQQYDTTRKQVHMFLTQTAAKAYGQAEIADPGKAPQHPDDLRNQLTGGDPNAVLSPKDQANVDEATERTQIYEESTKAFLAGKKAGRTALDPSKIASNLSTELGSLVKDLESAQQQAGGNTAHPNFYFTKYALDKLNQLLPFFSGASVGAPVDKIDLMQNIKRVHDSVVGAHSLAQRDYEVAAQEQQNKRTQWQDIGSYSPFWQALLLGVAQERRSPAVTLRSIINQFQSQPGVLENIAQSQGFNSVEDMNTWVDSNSSVMDQQTEQAEPTQRVAKRQSSL